MSAESPRLRSQSRQGKSTSVTPQHVTDPTILDSVAGFINDVVPTSYNLPIENDDKIQWAHFEQLENDIGNNDDDYGLSSSPLLLVLGYSNGIQIWAIPTTGEATEILSWRHGCVRVLRFIPNPFKIGGSELDFYASSRPLIALCDSALGYTALTFRSLKAGVQDPVKQIQFKSPILNILANRHSIVVTFAEKLAVFDAFTLESRISVTTCYLSPGIQPNPIALGTRWLAYAEKKLDSSLRSGGGNEGEGVQSYTASVLNAAKSLGRGLRELTDAVAGSLTGNQIYKPGTSPNSPQAGGVSDIPQKGIVTILDIENMNIDTKENLIPQDSIIAHFVAHSEAIVCLSFDPSGMLLLTADKRGHDFHLFRIQPHPVGSSLASIHHLYILHRGDTTAKVQDMCFSPDSRWVTISTLRGTTHVFPITPYGGNINVRTHANVHVVNKMSRYQRSAGLTIEGRSSSPVTLMETPVNSLFPYRNPRYQPYPQPIVVNPLAQIRQPVYIQNPSNTTPRTHAGRQRLPSSSEDNISLRVVACFAPSRAWMDNTAKLSRETTYKQQTKPIESLFIMSCHGNLVQYDLEPHPLSSVPKERVCNDTPIELKVYAKAQWPLHRTQNSIDLLLPMSKDHLNLIVQNVPIYKQTKPDHNDEQWLSQVEIVTHLGPHRRLWMGPQFTFKTYTITNGTVVETKPLDVGRSKPVNMPVSKANAVLIESGSASSCEQLFLDTYQRNCEEVGSAGELRLKEDLADAMLESPGIRETGGHCVIVSVKPTRKVVNPLGTVVTVQSEDDDDDNKTENEINEDVIIHENCDESLFRPVVAPKLFYSENKSKTCPPDNIITKNLETNTEVAVKILNRQKDDIKENNNQNKMISNKHIKPKSREVSPKIKTEKLTKSNIIETKIKSKTKKQDIDNLFDITSISKSSQIDFDMLNCEIEKINIVDSSSNDDRDSKITKSTEISENICKFEKFEDAEDCCDKLEKSITINKLDDDEKIVVKKTRKPKTKLGVKIQSGNKDRIKLGNTDLENSRQISPPPSSLLSLSSSSSGLKKSWNLIAAGKPPDRDVEIIEINTEYEPEPEIEFEETHTFKLPIKKENTDNLINNNDSIIKDDLLKIDKVSDDEKCYGSSPNETTESDDSISKIPIIIDEDDDISTTIISCGQSSSLSKSSKKKSKKKREQTTEITGRDVEDASSASSFSSASRASPTPSYSDNFIHFPGDSSSSM